MIEKINEILLLPDFKRIFNDHGECTRDAMSCQSCVSSLEHAIACKQSWAAFGVDLSKVNKRAFINYQAARRLYHALDLYKEERVDEVVYERHCCNDFVMTAAEKKAFNKRQRKVALNLLELLSPEFVAGEFEKDAEELKAADERARKDAQAPPIAPQHKSMGVA